MSHDGEASTARHDPSLTDITNRKPRSISTMVWLTVPASNTRAAPCVRLASPDATAESWSALARSSRSETAMSSPSDETTIACAMPGTRRAKFETSQLTFCASLLSSIIAALETKEPVDQTCTEPAIPYGSIPAELPVPRRPLLVSMGPCRPVPAQHRAHLARGGRHAAVVDALLVRLARRARHLLVVLGRTHRRGGQFEPVGPGRLEHRRADDRGDRSWR